MTGAEIVERIVEIGVVPIVRTTSADLALAAADALIEGGISVVEITLTIPNAVGVVRSLASRFGDRALVGAGTVLSAADAVACIDAGARFIVSPGLDAAVVEAAGRRGVAAIAGALTPTEVMAAIGMGSALVKIFPCSAVGGPRYVRALRGPFPRARLLPTGGVTLSTALDYIQAGADAVGMGSELVDEALLRAGEGAALAARSRGLAAAIRAVRSAREGARPAPFTP